MQLRCTYCQTMFAISHEETLAAIEHIVNNNLKYYDAHCPNCRRANRVERLKLESSYPGWQAAIKTMAKEADKSAAAQAAPASSTKETSSAKEKKPAGKKAAPVSGKTASPKKKPAVAASSLKAKKK